MPPVVRTFARKGGQPVGLRVSTQPGNAVISAIVTGRQRDPGTDSVELPFSVSFDDDGLEQGVAAWIPRAGWEYEAYLTSNVEVQTATVKLITGTNVQQTNLESAGPGVLALLRVRAF